jgi:tRNA-Thr(GGU) m(6)t(6)A37 methyltransferase TsaA
MRIEYQSIGVVRSPFKELQKVPNQSYYAKDVEGTVEVYPEFEAGLKDLDGFSHLFLICHFHMTTDYRLHIVPSADTELRGLFATRSPKRPNPIGISIVRLNKIEKNILFISDLDILDGTPVIDIKPYVAEFERFTNVRVGWMKSARHTNMSSNNNKL